MSKGLSSGTEGMLLTPNALHLPLPAFASKSALDDLRRERRKNLPFESSDIVSNRPCSGGKGSWGLEASGCWPALALVIDGPTCFNEVLQGVGDSLCCDWDFKLFGWRMCCGGVLTFMGGEACGDFVLGIAGGKVSCAGVLAVALQADRLSSLLNLLVRDEA